MGIVVRRLGDILIFDLKGDLVINRLEEFALHHRVKTALEAGSRNFLVNFAEVGFMDSSGFGELLSSFTSARKVGAHLKLEKLGSQVRLIFKITGIVDVFEIFDDEEAAVRSFHGAGHAR